MKYCENNPMVKYWTSDEVFPDLPSGQNDIKRKWKSSVMVDDGVSVTEYAVYPSSKVTLSQMLEIIMEKVRLLSDESTRDCGFKIW